MNLARAVEAGEFVVQNPRQQHEAVRLQVRVTQWGNVVNCPMVEHSLKHGLEFTRPGVPHAIFLSPVLCVRAQLDRTAETVGPSCPPSAVLLRRTGRSARRRSSPRTPKAFASGSFRGRVPPQHDPSSRQVTPLRPPQVWPAVPRIDNPGAVPRDRPVRELRRFVSFQASCQAIAGLGAAEFEPVGHYTAPGGSGTSAAGRWHKNGLASPWKLVLNVLYQRRFLCVVQPIV